MLVVNTLEVFTLLMKKVKLLTYNLRGAVVSAYSDFMNEHENKVEGNWITINKAEDKKKGATKYSVPIFEVGKTFTKDEMSLADEKYQDIVNYFDKYSKAVEVEEPETVEEEEDLAFSTQID